MSALRRLFWFFRPLRKRQYGPEVLYSGWVNLPR